MFTIKHITADGNEAVFEALEVMYNPHHFPVAVGEAPLPHGYVWYVDPKHKPTVDNVPLGIGHRRLEDGTVYVMNDNGATVARYYLGSYQQTPAEPVAEAA
jgi:hypothetical protein